MFSDLEDKLRDLLELILDEVREHPEFGARLHHIFNAAPQRQRIPRPDSIPAQEVGPRRRANRRAPALVDPVSLIQESEDRLRVQLSALDLEQLRDIVAEYGMDQAKLVMKWKTREKVVERIVEVARARSTKGDAFRT